MPLIAALHLYLHLQRLLLCLSSSFIDRLSAICLETWFASHIRRLCPDRCNPCLCLALLQVFLSSLTAFAFIYGFFSGAIVALVPFSVTATTSDMSQLSGRLGMAFTYNAYAMLVGGPIAGVLFKVGDVDVCGDLALSWRDGSSHRVLS